VVDTEAEGLSHDNKGVSGPPETLLVVEVNNKEDEVVSRLFRQKQENRLIREQYEQIKWKTPFPPSYQEPFKKPSLD